MKKEQYSKICKNYIEDIYIGATEVFGDGIYVKCGVHPCGWDFINFEYMECSDDMFNFQIGVDEISNGYYDYHNFKGMTIEKIIHTVGMKGWCFDISNVDNLR